MVINKAGLDLIKEFEGCRLTAYKDSAGVWTIGYGTTARAGLGIDPVAGMTITQAEADYWLEKGVNKFAAEIAPLITAPINENQFAAFVSLAYNIGTTAFRKSTALRKFNEGDPVGAADAMLMWNKAGGKMLSGLVRRREAERALFLRAVTVSIPTPEKPPSQSGGIGAIIQAIIKAIVAIIEGLRK